MNSATFNIDGMHCQGCAATIRAVLERTPGVRMVSASLEDRQARVLFDRERVDVARLAAVIEHLGYQVVGRP